MNLGFLSVRPSISQLLAVNEAVKLRLLILEKLRCSKPEPDFSSITPQTIRARVAPRDS